MAISRQQRGACAQRNCLINKTKPPLLICIYSKSSILHVCAPLLLGKTLSLFPFYRKEHCLRSQTSEWGSLESQSGVCDPGPRKGYTDV